MNLPKSDGRDCKAALDSRAVERYVHEIRFQLDYPERGEPYIAALNALDRLARLAHKAVRP